MRWWQISQPRYALEKTCAGAVQFGGRWNPIGLPALYCGSSISLCGLEKFVHVGSGPLPPLVLVAVDIPDTVNLYNPGLPALPPDWDTLPTSAAAQAFGAAWLRTASHLGMKVPSAVVPEENNLVLNPLHPDYSQVQLSIVRPFAFDDRMFNVQR